MLSERFIHSFFILITITLLIFFTGCISIIPPQNSSQQIPLPALPSLSPSVTAVQIIPTSSSIIPVTQTTITIKPDLTPLLTKGEAWNYAIPYLQSVGLSDIQPSEVKAFGPDEFYNNHNNRTVYWMFEIHRKDASGFEKGGIIFIDADGGHIIDFSGFA